MILSFYGANSKEKIILGVHGLSNKVSKELYTENWKKSIYEGIILIKPEFSKNINMEMCYWADFFYPEPLKYDSLMIAAIMNEEFSKLDSAKLDNEVYDFQPYLPAVNPVREKVNPLKSEIKKYAEKRFKGFLTGLKIPIPGNVTNLVIQNTLTELGFYFENKLIVVNHQMETELVRNAIQNDLIKLIKKHKDKEIMLIAHSMGTIIAYDVLMKLSKTNPEIKVNYFVTVGSPLGIPPVRDKIKSINGYKELKVPDNIKNAWYNFADSKDNAAFDPALEDNFKQNINKITVTDDMVTNDYTGPDGKQNFHKEYGYLRCERMSNLILYFLAQ